MSDGTFTDGNRHDVKSKAKGDPQTALRHPVAPLRRPAPPPTSTTAATRRCARSSSAATARWATPPSSRPTSSTPSRPIWRPSETALRLEGAAPRRLPAARAGVPSPEPCPSSPSSPPWSTSSSTARRLRAARALRHEEGRPLDVDDVRRVRLAGRALPRRARVARHRARRQRRVRREQPRRVGRRRLRLLRRSAPPSCPMYEAQNPKEWEFIVRDCEAKAPHRGERRGALARPRACSTRVPSLKNIVLIDGTTNGDGRITTYAALARLAARRPTPIKPAARRRRRPSSTRAARRATPRASSSRTPTSRRT